MKKMILLLIVFAAISMADPPECPLGVNRSGISVFNSSTITADKEEVRGNIFISGIRNITEINIWMGKSGDLQNYDSSDPQIDDVNAEAVDGVDEFRGEFTYNQSEYSVNSEDYTKGYEFFWVVQVTGEWAYFTENNSIAYETGTRCRMHSLTVNEVNYAAKINNFDEIKPNCVFTMPLTFEITDPDPKKNLVYQIQVTGGSSNGSQTFEKDVPETQKVTTIEDVDLESGFGEYIVTFSVKNTEYEFSRVVQKLLIFYTEDQATCEYKKREKHTVLMKDEEVRFAQYVDPIFTTNQIEINLNARAVRTSVLQRDNHQYVFEFGDGSVITRSKSEMDGSLPPLHSYERNGTYSYRYYLTYRERRYDYFGRLLSTAYPEKTIEAYSVNVTSFRVNKNRISIPFAANSFQDALQIAQDLGGGEIYADESDAGDNLTADLNIIVQPTYLYVRNPYVNINGTPLNTLISETAQSRDWFVAELRQDNCKAKVAENVYNLTPVMMLLLND